MNGKKTFIKITNEMIYNELKQFEKDNEEAHKQIITKHDTNKASIDVLKWVAGSALAIGVFVCAGLVTKVL